MSLRARLIVPVLVFLLLCLLEDSQCGAARQRARHRRLFRGESELGTGLVVMVQQDGNQKR